MGTLDVTSRSELRCDYGFAGRFYFLQPGQLVVSVVTNVPYVYVLQVGSSKSAASVRCVARVQLKSGLYYFYNPTNAFGASVVLRTSLEVAFSRRLGLRAAPWSSRVPGAYSAIWNAASVNVSTASLVAWDVGNGAMELTPDPGGHLPRTVEMSDGTFAYLDGGENVGSLRCASLEVIQLVAIVAVLWLASWSARIALGGDDSHEILARVSFHLHKKPCAGSIVCEESCEVEAVLTQTSGLTAHLNVGVSGSGLTTADGLAVLGERRRPPKAGYRLPPVLG
jgi:hypothetical protein